MISHAIPIGLPVMILRQVVYKILLEIVDTVCRQSHVLSSAEERKENE